MSHGRHAATEPTAPLPRRTPYAEWAALENTWPSAFDLAAAEQTEAQRQAAMSAQRAKYRAAAPAPELMQQILDGLEALPVFEPDTRPEVE